MKICWRKHRDLRERITGRKCPKLPSETVPEHGVVVAATNRSAAERYRRLVALRSNLEHANRQAS